MKTGTPKGEIPVKVSENCLAIVTAGFAKLVEEVNQYAEAIYEPTKTGKFSLTNSLPRKITKINPKVANISDKNCERSCRARVEIVTAGNSKIILATIHPKTPPLICKITYAMKSVNEITFLNQNTRDTTGLKWAPEIGPKIEIITTNVNPVGIAFPNNVTPSSWERWSAIIPEPTTVKTRKNDPKNSQTYF